jgi:hypothetical protein
VGSPASVKGDEIIMSLTYWESTVAKPRHPWLRRVRVAFVPGPITPLLEKVAHGLLRHFRLRGDEVQDEPSDETDVLLTTARFGEPLGWRDALLFSARRRFRLSRSPTLFTLVHIAPARLRSALVHFRAALAKEPPDLDYYVFTGLAPQAHRVLIEQGHRGGPILSLERLVQAQAKSIRILLVVGDDEPVAAYHFDLVGAHPRSDAADLEAFYQDIVLRTVTTVSTWEVTEHKAVGEAIPHTLWKQLDTPAAMRVAAQRLGEQKFFTEMVRIADLVQVPAVAESVASQYSEGCFATWDPRLGALVATITGSARPIDKDKITDEDLAVIVGVRADSRGALVRHVEGKHNNPPSSESMEMMAMDSALPRVTLGPEWDTAAQVPVARSKLHGHRGVGGYDPRWVEYAPLSPPYFHYLVSCATGAQAEGIREAFSRSEALQNPEDQRQVVFTVLPGHGAVIVEKWVPGTVPFQTIWEYMDAGHLQVVNAIPQGPMRFVPGPGGRMVLEAEPALADTE